MLFPESFTESTDIPYLIVESLVASSFVQFAHSPEHLIVGIAVLILAYKIFKCDEYLQTVCEQLNYILGKNPMDICYVTGFGSKSVMHPHHRPSEADETEEPVPGLLVCGPNKDV